MNVQMQRRSRVSFKGCRVSVKCSRVSLKAGGFGTDPASQQLLTRNASDNTEDDEISQVGENGPWSSDSEEDEQPSVRRFAGSAPPSSLGTGLFFGLPVRVCPGAQGVTAKATAQVSTPDYYPDREEGLWPENLMARFSLMTCFCHETSVGTLNRGFPFSLVQSRQGRTRMDEWMILKKCVRCMQ